MTLPGIRRDRAAAGLLAALLAAGGAAAQAPPADGSPAPAGGATAAGDAEPGTDAGPGDPGSDAPEPAAEGPAGTPGELARATGDAAEPPAAVGPEPGSEAAADAVEGPPEPPAWGPFEILGARIEPGEKARLSLATGESFAGTRVTVPVTAIHGTSPGAVICITGGIHGDELNGVEIARRVLSRIPHEQLRGTLIGIPIVNLHGFRRSSRYLPDRRDLNRYFPGHPRGSSASRIAHAVFDGVVRWCDALVDLHSGSFHRSNIPQVRANLNDPATQDLALAFGSEIVVHSPGQVGTLRRAATDAGIPSITYEAGEPMRFQREEIERGITGLRRLLEHLGAMPVDDPLVGPTELFWSASWIRVDEGGILRSAVSLGQRVRTGDLLGIVIDPLTDEHAEIRSTQTGRVIGMALDQVVIPGFAAYNVASERRRLDGDGLLDTDNPPVESSPPEDMSERPE